MDELPLSNQYRIDDLDKMTPAEWTELLRDLRSRHLLRNRDLRTLANAIEDLLAR